MTKPTAADILHELDRAIINSKKEAQAVIRGEVANAKHPNPLEYIMFLNHAAKAFHGMRMYLRSDDFARKLGGHK